MRVLLKVQMDVEAGNRGIQDGTLPSIIQSFVERFNPEAAYFLPESGQRTAYFFFDLRDPSQIPVVAEPLFSGVNAKVDLTPVMNLEDLQAGLREAATRR